MRNKDADPAKLAVLGAYAICTAFWAIVWHYPWPDQGGEYNEAFGLFGTLCNLGLIGLTIPWFYYLIADLGASRVRGSLRLVKYLPSLLCMETTPEMFSPFSWLLTLFGAS